MDENNNTAVGEASPMPGTPAFTMACFEAEKVPVGTKLYAAPIAADQEQARGMVGLTDDAVHYVLRQYFDGVTAEKAGDIAHDLRIGLGAAPPCALSASGETK